MIDLWRTGKHDVPTPQIIVIKSCNASGILHDEPTGEGVAQPTSDKRPTLLNQLRFHSLIRKVSDHAVDLNGSPFRNAHDPHGARFLVRKYTRDPPVEETEYCSKHRERQPAHLDAVRELIPPGWLVLAQHRSVKKREDGTCT